MKRLLFLLSFSLVLCASFKDDHYCGFPRSNGTLCGAMVPTGQEYCFVHQPKTPQPPKPKPDQVKE